jgi:hypothetical protein
MEHMSSIIPIREDLFTFKAPNTTSRPLETRSTLFVYDVESLTGIKTKLQARDLTRAPLKLSACAIEIRLNDFFNRLPFFNEISRETGQQGSTGEKLVLPLCANTQTALKQSL